MDEAVQGVRRFHEQDVDVKKGFYTRDISSTLVYNNNYDLYSSPALNLRDTFFSFMALSPPPPEELTEVCRHSNRVLKSSHEIRRRTFQIILRGIGVKRESPEVYKDIQID
ncbi:hypothetical protein Lser_V15G28550 [Lactuca serriola]